MPFDDYGEAGFPSIVVSNCIYNNEVTVSSAKLTASYTGNVNFFLKTDSNDWEIITSGSTHTFANPGYRIYWKAIGETGATITNLQVQIY